MFTGSNLVCRSSRTPRARPIVETTEVAIPNSTVETIPPAVAGCERAICRKICSDTDHYFHDFCIRREASLQPSGSWLIFAAISCAAQEVSPKNTNAARHRTALSQCQVRTLAQEARWDALGKWKGIDKDFYAITTITKFVLGRRRASPADCCQRGSQCGVGIVKKAAKPDLRFSKPGIRSARKIRAKRVCVISVDQEPGSLDQLEAVDNCLVCSHRIVFNHVVVS